MRSKNPVRGFKAEVIKQTLGIDESRYRLLVKSVFENKTDSFYTYNQVIQLRIANYLLDIRKVTKNYLDFVGWGRVENLLRTHDHKSFNDATLSLDISDNSVDLYLSLADVKSKSSKTRHVDLNTIMKQQRKSFERFSFNSIYAVKTASSLLAISPKTINEWDKYLGLIKKAPKLSSIEIFIYHLLKVYLIESKFSKNELCGLNWSLLTNFLNNYKGENVGSMEILLCLETKSILIFSSYSECMRYSLEGFTIPIKPILEEYIDSFRNIGKRIDNRYSRTNTNPKLPPPKNHLTLVK